MADREWTSSEVLAFTERDGPGNPPPAPRRWTAVTLAGALGVVFTGMLFTDTLCPEHRAWVSGLALTALFGAIVAVIGLLRDWAGAAIITTLTAGIGVSIGLIDTIHSPTRGRFLALTFAVITVAAAMLCTQYVRVLRWDRKVHRELRPLTTPALPVDDARADDVWADRVETIRDDERTIASESEPATTSDS
jgi:hypothetical protein